MDALLAPSVLFNSFAVVSRMVLILLVRLILVVISYSSVVELYLLTELLEQPRMRDDRGEAAAQGFPAFPRHFPNKHQAVCFPH